MILKALGRSHVADDKLWELVEKANDLTQGGYKDWDNNAEALVPVMERILLRAREVEDWQVYFYNMSKLFWYVRRNEVNQLRLAFQIAEMFHQDYQSGIGEHVSQFGKEFRTNVAAEILSFYCNYPQIDDAKIEQMQAIYQDCESRFGDEWNNGDYRTLMDLALQNKDRAFATKAARRLKKVRYQNWCYICTYGWPMMGYYILEEDYEAARELVCKLAKREIPVNYRWCLEKCQRAEEGKVVGRALIYCLQLGKSSYFERFFAEWAHIYRDSKKREVEDTHVELFHALAGEWSHQDEQLKLAEQDDKDRREQKQTPLDSLYWSLCWFCYFQLLERSGVSRVCLELSGKEDKMDEAKQEWTCKEAAEYFEQRADELGEQMDRARKRFGYADIKKCYMECLLKKE